MPTEPSAPAPPPTFRRGPAKTAWYWLTSTALWAASKLLYRMKTEGRLRVPSEGPAVLLANHTSHLDPPLVGGATRRQLSFLARDTLFVGVLGRLIRTYEALPVDRDGAGIGGVRAILKRLKQGGAVLLFPEGTRSADGELQEFKPGFVALVRRGKAPIVPIGIAGAHEAWPRGAKRPHLTGRVALHYGEPIGLDQIAELSDAELVDLAHRRVAECLAEAERSIGKRH